MARVRSLTGTGRGGHVLRRVAEVAELRNQVLFFSAILNIERVYRGRKHWCVMAQYKRSSSVWRFTESWFYRAMPLKIRASYLSRVTDGYLGELDATVQEPQEDSVVGYESSWPDKDTGLQ